jgi:hypothetical protein
MKIFRLITKSYGRANVEIPDIELIKCFQMQHEIYFGWFLVLKTNSGHKGDAEWVNRPDIANDTHGIVPMFIKDPFIACAYAEYGLFYTVHIMDMKAIGKLLFIEKIDECIACSHFMTVMVVVVVLPRFLVPHVLGKNPSKE